MESMNDIESLMKSQLNEELKRTNRVKSLAIRTVNSHIKIDEARQKVTQIIEQKKQATLEKQEAAEKRFAERKTLLAAQVVGVEKSLKEHEERRIKIEKEREDLTLQNFDSKKDKHLQIAEMKVRLMEETLKNTMKNSSELITDIEHLRVAKELDENFRVKSAYDLNMRNIRSSKHIERIKLEEAKQLSDAKLKQSLLEFKCEQRKRLFKLESEQNAELLKIQLEKLNAFKDIQDSINYQRPNALKQVFQENYATANQSISIVPVSPGPGEYEVDSAYKKKIIGGYMPIRNNIVELKTITPGPGTYDPNTNDDPNIQKLAMLRKSSGVLPFNGRGKTDVDWLILQSKLKPGPGDYNIESKRNIGGKFGCAKIKTDLDIKLEIKKEIPGVGTYDINPDIKKQTTLTNIAKKNSITNFLDTDNYNQLYNCYK